MAPYLFHILVLISSFGIFSSLANTARDKPSSTVEFTLNFDHEGSATPVEIPENRNVQKILYVKPNNEIKTIEGKKITDDQNSDSSTMIESKILPPRAIKYSHNNHKNHRFIFPKFSNDLKKSHDDKMESAEGKFLVPELQVGCEEGFTEEKSLHDPKSKKTKQLHVRKPRDLSNQKNTTRIPRQIYPIYPIPVPVYDYPRYIEPRPYWQPYPAAAIYPIPLYPVATTVPFLLPQPYPTEPRSWANRARNTPWNQFHNHHNNRIPTYVNPNDDRRHPYPPRLSNEEVRNRLGWNKPSHPNQIPPPQPPQTPGEICNSDYIRNCPGITRIDGEIRRKPIQTGSGVPVGRTSPTSTKFPIPHRKPTLPPPFFASTPKSSTSRPFIPTKPLPTLRDLLPYSTTTLKPDQSQTGKCKESDLTKCPGFSSINIDHKKPAPSTVRPKPTECASTDIRDCPGFTNIDESFSRRRPAKVAPAFTPKPQTDLSLDEENEEELEVVPNPAVGTEEPSLTDYDDEIPEDCFEDDITKCPGYNPVTIPPLKATSSSLPSSEGCLEDDITKCPGFNPVTIPPLKPSSTSPPSVKKAHPDSCDENDITKCSGFAELFPVPTKSPALSENEEREKRNNAGRCVWAIVTCCNRDEENIRKGCFTIMGCPAKEWTDMDPCGETFSQKTLGVTRKYF